MSKKRGNPTDTARPVTFTIPRGGDYLDNFDGSAARQVTPTPEPESELEEEPPAPEPEASEAVADTPAEPTAPEEPVVELAPAAPKKVVKKRASKKSAANKPKKKRPPRADIGFRQDLEDAALKLQKHVVLQSQEPNANRTDVIAQATCAVARALEDIDCKKVPRRGHFGSASARIFDAALQEALYKGVAHHYIKNNVRHLPDHLLERCYNEYRRQNALDDESGS